MAAGEGEAAPFEGGGALELVVRVTLRVQLEVLQRVQALIQTLDRLLATALHVIDYIIYN